MIKKLQKGWGMIKDYRLDPDPIPLTLLRTKSDF